MLLPGPARAEDLGDLGLDDGDYRALLRQLDEEYATVSDGFSLSDQAEAADAGLWPRLTSLFSSLLLGELKNSAGLLARLLALALLSLLLTLLRDSLSDGRTAALSAWVVSLLLLSLALTSFSSCMQAAKQAVDDVSQLLFVLLPLLMPLLAALGGVSTAASLAPALLFCLNLLMELLKKAVFPLIWCGALLRLCAQLAPSFNVSRLAALCRDVAIGLLSVITTVFVAFLSLSGLASAGRDGLAVKAAKTASSAFVPLVGRALADSLDSVLGTVLALKGTLGLSGALALLLICGVPAVRILIQALLFRLTAALAQPLGDENLSAALTGMGQSLTLMFAALAVAGLFSFFALALTVAMGSVTMMMR